MNTTYNPKPLPDDGIVLPDGLLEKLAAHVHDAWAARKRLEGWTYGEAKDEVEKTTPCLVPYNELPEQEKEYDRRTALETIKALVKLGYQIVLKGS